jgi:hypothetical protein
MDCAPKLKFYRLAFQGADLPPFGCFLDVAAAIAAVPEETALWFWRFSICVGAGRQDTSSTILRHTHALRAAFPSHADLWADELNRRFPGHSPEVILREWLTSLDMISRAAGEWDACSWEAYDGGGENAGKSAGAPT